ncbi:MAG: hypothetical protein QHH00_04490 [Methanomassiliicoccales archaeon]|jgi:hypothetical protein|nr:hypothetical protein [Methanomassiliicoccales archaeon]
MTDIRRRVEEDRGLLKRIQSYIPGFRGYRFREDLRDADRMLRGQLADKLAKQRKELEECRSFLAQHQSFEILDAIGGLINQFKKLEGLVSYAETGYSGLVSDITIHEEELNTLYEYDLRMLELQSSISSDIDDLKRDTMNVEMKKVERMITDIKSKAADFEDQFRSRLRVVEGTEV